MKCRWLWIFTLSRAVHTGGKLCGGSGHAVLVVPGEGGVRRVVLRHERGLSLSHAGRVFRTDMVQERTSWGSSYATTVSTWSAPDPRWSAGATAPRAALRRSKRPTYPRGVGPGHSQRVRAVDEHSLTEREHLRLRAAPLAEHGTSRSISSATLRALHRHQGAVGGDQGHGPLQQPLEWRHCARGDHVERALAVDRIGPAAHHLDVARATARPRPPRGTSSVAAGAPPASPGDPVARSRAPGPGAQPRSRCRRPWPPAAPLPRGPRS